MSTELPSAVSIPDVLRALTPLVGRTPASDENDEAGWAATLGEMGNAGIYVVDYDGISEWERHPHGDELVMVLDGASTMYMLIDGEDVPFQLGPMELIVVPQGTWHRFETPERSQIMTVTPQPTDHSIERPTG